MLDTSSHVVLLSHGICSSESAMMVIARQIVPTGLEVDTLDWSTATGHNKATPGYSMACLRAAAKRRLEQYAREGKRVILLTHSAGGFVLGHWINHPAVVGALYLAMPPLGPYANRGAGWLHRTTRKIGWRSLWGMPVEFTEADQRIYQVPEQYISGSVWESGRVMRGFRLPGYRVPPNEQNKPALFHASAADGVIPAGRVAKGMQSLGYHPLDGGQDLRHCDYLMFTDEQRTFMSRQVIPAIQRMLR